MIPSLDLNHFIHGDATAKSEFVKQLGEAYEDIGFAAIKNHLLDDELVQKLYEQTKEFFDLPLEVKNKYSDPALAGQRGYTGWGKEHAKDLLWAI